MTSKMLINAVDTEEYRVAIIKDGLLDGFHIESTTSEDKIGNIYKGIVQRIEPSLQACFVDFGGDKNGFLPGNEIHPEYFQKENHKVKEHPPIDQILKKGQELLIQVRKEMPGKKGAQLTTYLSFAGRYLAGLCFEPSQQKRHPHRQPLAISMSNMFLNSAPGVMRGENRGCHRSSSK